MTQEQLGSAVGVSFRTVGNWERGASSPEHSMGKIVEVLGPYLPADSGRDDVSLRSATDAQLLAEVARRFGRPVTVQSESADLRVPRPASE